MIEDDFYATLKLISGEELVSKVSPCDEHDRIILILDSPVLVKEINLTRLNVSGIQFEPWIKMSTDSMFLIDMKNILTITEIDDDEMIHMYEKFIQKCKRYNKNQSNRSNITTQMGYVASVDEFKKKLERLYKGS